MDQTWWKPSRIHPPMKTYSYKVVVSYVARILAILAIKGLNKCSDRYKILINLQFKKKYGVTLSFGHCVKIMNNLFLFLFCFASVFARGLDVQI